MYYVTKRFQFDAAHRLRDYDGPCSRIHGHTYQVEVTFGGAILNPLGMLIDFGEVKKIVQPLIDRWDHRLIVHADDDLVALDNPLFLESVTDMKEGNPTAENMAREIFEEVDREFGTQRERKLRMRSVRVYETPDCWAEYRGYE